MRGNRLILGGHTGEGKTTKALVDLLEDGNPDAAEQVRRLRKLERR